jgi:hypothetical protein
MKDITIYVTTHRTGKETVRVRKFTDAELAKHGMTQRPVAINWKTIRALATMLPEGDTSCEGLVPAPEGEVQP